MPPAERRELEKVVAAESPLERVRAVCHRRPFAGPPREGRSYVGSLADDGHRQKRDSSETDSGLKPATEGWFVVNVGETGWAVHDSFGSGCTFEGREAQFKQLGINISVVEPGQPLCLYHEESAQEDFLVLAGECVLLVNGRSARSRRGTSSTARPAPST